MNIKWYIVLILFMLAIMFANAAFASQTPYKVICHHTPANQVTLSFQNLQSWLGHLGTPHSGSTYDTNGACVQPTSTPTATPTVVIPSPTITQCDGECVTPTPTEEVTPTPTREPEVTPVVEEHHEGLSAPTFAMCADLTPTRVNDMWVENPVSNDNKLTVRWGTNPNYGNVHIRYTDGQVGDWRYALLNTSNDGSEEIGGLKNGVHYWFSVAYVNGCAVGQYSSPFDPTP